VFNPSDFRAYLARRIGVPQSEISVPEDIIFTYDTGIFRAAIADAAASPVVWYIYHDRMYQGNVGGKRVGIVHAMVGAPAASMNLEELVAYGAKRMYEAGLSGAIDAALKPGDVVLLRGALSDEGTSKHYFRAGSKFESSHTLTGMLEASMRKRGLNFTTGLAWTTDAPYRETVQKVARFRRAGSKVVNMESSAVFAIAKYRGVEAASVQIVSDLVTEKKWEPAFHAVDVDARRADVLAAVLDAISG
jgi:uridine phosphorylase